MTAPARVPVEDEPPVDGPLDGIDWSAAWETEGASRMFGKVKAFCGVPTARPEPLTSDVVQAALAEARSVLDGLDGEEDEEPIADEVEDFGGWDASDFWRCCAEADARARAQPVSEDIQRARRLLDEDWSFERTWQTTNHQAAVEGRAAWSTVEALMLGLRERGTAALEEPETRRRLAELPDVQVIEVGARLRRLKPPTAAPWTADQVAMLIQTRERLK
jgi:hypothetical protein